MARFHLEEGGGEIGGVGVSGLSAGCMYVRCRFFVRIPPSFVQLLVYH